MAHKRLFILEKDEKPSDGIFTAVLSGMASVFNKTVKTPRKKYTKSKNAVKDSASAVENVEEADSTSNQVEAGGTPPSEEVVAQDPVEMEQSSIEEDLGDKQADKSSQESASAEPPQDIVFEEINVQPSTSVTESIQTDLTISSLDKSGEEHSFESIQSLEDSQEKTHKRHSPKKKSRKKMKKDEEKAVSDNEDPLDTVNVDVDKQSCVLEDSVVKPRIVLTFRSEKIGPRGTNVKIVTDSEKAAEKSSSINKLSSRRSLRNNKVGADSNKISPESLDEQGDSLKVGACESDDGLKSENSSKKSKNLNGSSMSDSNSDDSHSPNKEGVKRSIRHKSREHSDSVLANAMARKEKSINETLTAGTTRLSRRIKPTAKVLANRELRIGFETQNNARLALATETTSPAEGKMLAKSKPKKSSEKSKVSIMAPSKSHKNIKEEDKYEFTEEFDVEDIEKPECSILHVETDECNPSSVEDKSVDGSKDDEDDDQDSDRSKSADKDLSAEEVEVRRVNKLKKKHLKKLGLKEVSEKLSTQKDLSDRELLSDESTMDSTNTEAIVEHLNARSRSADLGQPASPDTARILETIALFEEEDEDTKAKESSDEEYNPYEHERLPKKSKKRKASSSDLEDSLPIVQLSRLSEETIKAKVRSTRKRSRKEPAAEVEFVECGDGSVQDLDTNTMLTSSEEESEEEEEYSVAGEGNVGVGAGSKCLCTQNTNIYLHPSGVDDPEFCRAVDWVNGRAVGCGRVANTGLPLVRASVRAPYFLPCNMHRRRLFSHHCCSACGAFCTQGVFYQCREGHLFHWECGLPFVSVLMPSLIAEAQNTTLAKINNSTKQTEEQESTEKPVEETPSATPAAEGEAESTPVVTPPPAATSKPTANDIYNSQPGCPHCGLDEDTLEPLNVDCSRVLIEMKTKGCKMLLPNPRFQWFPSRMMFKQSGNEKQLKVDNIEDIDDLVNQVDQDVPIIPADLLPGLLDGLNVLKDRLERESPAGAQDADNAMATKELVKGVCEKDKSIEKIIAALVDGADPRKPLSEADGGNLLHVAGRELNLQAAHLCRILGCPLNSIDSKRRTPLMVAIISYDNRIKMIEKECEFSGVGGISKEPKADKEEREERMDVLKKACKAELYNIVRYMMKAGCDPTIQGPEGVTALHLAAKNCDVGACALILEGHLVTCKALLNQKDAGGWTPLVWAAENNNVHVVRYLLEKGADPLIADTEKNIALHWAAVSGCSRSLEALLNAGCPVDIANIHGDTPLHVSARQDNYNCLVVLIARGAKMDSKNSNGETPFDGCDEESNCYSVLATNNQLGPLITALSKNELVVSSDISNGKEINVVPCVNGVDEVTELGHFTYVTECCSPNIITIDRRISSMEACKCTGRCGQGDTSCNCTDISMQSWYEPTGKLVPHFDYDDPPVIFECNEMCSCNKNTCLNRSLSRGPHCVLDVFRCDKPLKDVPSKGWGVRAGTHIQRGQLVTEYTGELITTKEAHEREDHSYLFQLDSKQGFHEEEKDTYCIDARYYGNVSRFINHSCRPNLVPVRVFTSHRDILFPRIAFFACRDIKPKEEITFDYGDHFWSAKSTSMKCLCEADNCRFTDRKTEPFEDAYDGSKEEEDSADDDDNNHDDIMECDDVDVSLVKQEDLSLDLF